MLASQYLKSLHCSYLTQWLLLCVFFVLYIITVLKTIIGRCQPGKYKFYSTYWFDDLSCCIIHRLSQEPHLTRKPSCFVHFRLFWLVLKQDCWHIVSDIFNCHSLPLLIWLSHQRLSILPRSPLERYFIPQKRISTWWSPVTSAGRNGYSEWFLTCSR